MCVKAIGKGIFGETISTRKAPLILSAPNTVCSGSFFQISGNGLTVNHNGQLIEFGCKEALNLIKYMQTKFFRCLLDVVKTTQDIYQTKFIFTPVQDFTKYSDIDWTKSLDEIDEQLFRKYQLTSDEINFIKTKVQSQDNYFATLPKNPDINQK